MQLLTKMSAASLASKNIMRLFSIPEGKALPEIGSEVIIGRIIGVAYGVKEVTTTFGLSYGFKGQFEGTSYEDGEIFQSATLYLPTTATDALLPMVKEHGDNGVQLAFDIGARAVVDRANKDGVKYEFIVKPLIESKPSDVMAHLKANLPALPAPRKSLNPTPTLAAPEPTLAAPEPTAAPQRAPEAEKTKAKK